MRTTLLLLGMAMACWTALAAAADDLKLPAAWEMSAPLITPVPREKAPTVSVKDPSFVFSGERWHVFMTIKCEGLTPIEYVSFDKWDNADKAARTILRVSDSKYYCAPQVFYFRPQQKWYLVYQMGVPNSPRKMMWVACSTTSDIADPTSWTKAQPILDGGAGDDRKEGGLDYWIICDDQRAYLFFTSLNGKMWRMWTKLEDFPRGMAHCELALQADVFEASHTYRLKGVEKPGNGDRHPIGEKPTQGPQGHADSEPVPISGPAKYLTIIEANPGGRRYYKAYLADRLDGPWRPQADTEAKPFAGAANVRPAAGAKLWADNISHGELIREGCDETMTVDPANLRFIFQGATQEEKAGRNYGQIPWRIGLLSSK